jgi:hypothetical protein
VIDLLESLRGIALGTRVDNLNRLFDFLHPLLAECVKILGKSFSVKNIRNYFMPKNHICSNFRGATPLDPPLHANHYITDAVIIVFSK